MKRGYEQILGIWTMAWQPPDRQDPADWIVENIRLEDGSKFDLDMFPWLREICSNFSNYSLWLQIIIAPTQVGKSRSMEAAAIYWLAEDPGDVVCYADTIDKAEAWAKQRLIKIAAKTEKLQKFIPDGRYQVTNSQIQFSHAVLEVRAANSTSTQSITRRYVVCDEAFKYAAGLLDNAIRRSNAPVFAGRRKVVVGTTAWDATSEVEELIAAAELRVWHADCPHCQKPHAFVLNKVHQRRLPDAYPVFELAWDTNEKTYRNGEWDWEELAPTVQLQCSTCSTKIADTPTNRAHLRRTGRYISLRGNGRETCCWLVNAIAVGGGPGSAYRWSELVKKFLQAQRLSKMGIMEPLKEVLTKDFCEPWVEDTEYAAKIHVGGDYQMVAHEDGINWLPLGSWEHEKERVMCVDHQATDPKFYYTVRAFSEKGESRLAEAGTATSWAELDRIAERHELIGKTLKNGKPDNRFVFVDAGYDAAEVWTECADRRWFALRGDDRVSYPHYSVGLDGKRNYTTKPFSVATPRQPGFVKGGRFSQVRCLERSWSNLQIKDILARLSQGRGSYWGLPTNLPAGYLDHLQSEKKIKKVNKWVWEQIGERANHWWDCENMCIVAAMIRGLLQYEIAVDAPPVDAEETKEDEH